MNCYVVNPKKYYDIPEGINKENTLFFPERSMSTIDKHTTARPAEFHIITDCPEFVGLYDRKEVFVWRGTKFENPTMQTYGASLSIIMDEIFGIQKSIPVATIDRKLTTNCMGRPLMRENRER